MSLELANPDPKWSGWAGLAGPLVAVLEAWGCNESNPLPHRSGAMEEARGAKVGLGFQGLSASCWKMTCMQGGI